MEFASSFSQPLRLTYSLHSKTMMDSIQSCQRRLCYTDVQIIADGGVVFAHSIVLAAASNFLKQLLITNPDPTIVVHLPGVDYEPLRLLLEVLYGGEELQLTLKQVLALQNLGSLLHIDMCNSAAMEQAFLQASNEGVLTIPESMQQHCMVDGVTSFYPSTSFSDEESPVPSPIPVQEVVVNKRNSARMSAPTTAKSQAARKRKSAPSPGPVAPFSLLANVGTPPKPSRASKIQVEVNDSEEVQEMGEEPEGVPATVVQHKKPSRAATRELVTCRECHKPFKLIMQLNQHMSREGHLFPPCPECGVPFATLEALMAHADAHAPETVFTCKYCQKGVLGHDRYLYHMLMCKSLIRGDYVCFICRKAFRNSGSLKTHLLLHTGAKPFPCNYCSASFRQRHHRSHHERSVHLMQQGLVELEVTEGTDVNSSLNSGSPAVDGSRPFPCSHCNASFRQSNHRSYHERVIHGVDRRTRLPKSHVTPQQELVVVGKTNGDGNGYTILDPEDVEQEEEEVEADENDNEPVDDHEIDAEMVEELEADVEWEDEGPSPVQDVEAEDEDVNEENGSTALEENLPQND